jgi:sucrose-6-phosphate hydrolase SacC (GH32 family)
MAGLAVADRLEGPYRRHPENPLIDHRAEGKQVEDPYVFIENGAFKMIVRDMGVIDDRAGLIYESDDGIHWSEPKTAYERSTRYFGGEAQRFERPQILWKDDKPEYLFLSFMGGATGTSSGAVLKID